MNILGLTGILAACREDYKHRYDDFLKEYKAELKRIEQGYKGELLKEKREEAKTKFEEEVQAEREAVKESVAKYFNELRDDELFEASRIDVTAMEKLRAVSELPLTTEELSVLQSKYAPNNEYWPARMIVHLAEKNGLNPSQYINTAALDVKMDILSQLEKQLSDLVENYDGTPKYKTGVLLCDPVLLRAERIYTNGWRVDMEDEDVARRAFLQLKGKSVFEQGIALGNILRNTSLEMKKALFYEIATDGGIDDAVMRWSGLEEEYNAYKSGEHEQYSEARNIMAKTLLAKNKEDVERVASTASENRYYNDMLKRASKTNVYIEEYLNDSNGETFEETSTEQE